MAVSHSMRRGLAVSGLGVMVLAGCDEGGQFALFQPQAGSTSEASAQAAPAETVDRDVEAPEVFGVTDKGSGTGVRRSAGSGWRIPMSRSPSAC